MAGQRGICVFLLPELSFQKKAKSTELFSKIKAELSGKEKKEKNLKTTLAKYNILI